MSMSVLNTIARGLNKAQQKSPLLSVTIAVIKKYGDDQGNNHAAVITLYAFLSLFPLLLVFLTVLQFVLVSHPELRHSILDSALAGLPVLSGELQKNVRSLRGSGIGLVVGLITSILGGLGVASAIRAACNDLWQIPRVERVGFPISYVRNLALVTVGGMGAIITSATAGYIAYRGSWLYSIATLLIGFVAILISYRLAASFHVATKKLILPAALTAVAFAVLQLLGGYLVKHQLQHLGTLYGSFAVVLGLIFWIYLQTRAALYALEVGVVIDRRLWPRSLDDSDLTPADKQVLRSYAHLEQRHSSEQITTTFEPRPKQRMEQ